jgi:hypothetical protein
VIGTTSSRTENLGHTKREREREIRSPEERNTRDKTQRVPTHKQKSETQHTLTPTTRNPKNQTTVKTEILNPKRSKKSGNESAGAPPPFLPLLLGS